MSNHHPAIAPSGHDAQAGASLPRPVTITESSLCIHEFTTTGPAFDATSEAAKCGDDPVAVLHRILDLGGGLVQHRGARATVEAVGSEVNRVIDTIASVAGEQLPETMDQFVAKLGEVLGARFEGEQSVQNQLRDLLQKTSAEQRQEFVRALIADGGPLGVLGAQLREISRKEDELGRQVTALTERLAAQERVDTEYERGAAKGVDYQQLVHAAVDCVVAPYEDTTEFTGDHLGTDRNKKGDSVVTLDRRWTGGRDLRVVVEAKDDHMSMKAAMTEVSAAMSNREAIAGVMCFASADKAPTSGRALRMCGANRLVCVYDRCELNPLVLECALSVARAMAIATIAPSTETIDTAKIGEAVERLVEIIDTAKAIRRGSKAAHKGLTAIDAAYDDLRTDAMSVVEELREAITS